MFNLIYSGSTIYSAWCAFTLLELLGSLFIGTFVLAISFSIFFQNHSIMTRAQALAEIEENAIFATHQLRESIQRAGFIGCAHLTSEFPFLDLGTSYWNHMDFYDQLKVYQGEGNHWLPTIPSDFSIKPKEGSDVLIVHALDSLTGHVLDYSGNQIVVTPLSTLEAGQDIIISNCQKALSLPIRSIRKEGDNERLTFSIFIPQEAMGSNMELGVLKTSAFFIEKTDRKDMQGNSITALFVMDESHRRAELVSNVKNFKVHYLVLDDFHNLQVREPKEVTSISQVVAVQIELILESSLPVFVNSQKMVLSKTETVTIPLREQRV